MQHLLIDAAHAYAAYTCIPVPMHFPCLTPTAGQSQIFPADCSARCRSAISVSTVSFCWLSCPIFFSGFKLSFHCWKTKNVENQWASRKTIQNSTPDTPVGRGFGIGKFCHVRTAGHSSIPGFYLHEVASGVIKHGWLENHRTEWRFLARKITDFYYFYGQFSIHVWWHRMVWKPQSEPGLRCSSRWAAREA